MARGRCSWVGQGTGGGHWSRGGDICRGRGRSSTGVARDRPQGVQGPESIERKLRRERLQPQRARHPPQTGRKAPHLPPTPRRVSWPLHDQHFRQVGAAAWRGGVRWCGGAGAHRARARGCLAVGALALDCRGGREGAAGGVGWPGVGARDVGRGCWGAAPRSWRAPCRSTPCSLAKSSSLSGLVRLRATPARAHSRAN